MIIWLIFLSVLTIIGLLGIYYFGFKKYTDEVLVPFIVFIFMLFFSWLLFCINYSYNYKIYDLKNKFERFGEFYSLKDCELTLNKIKNKDNYICIKTK